jgi:hypothetical protein
MIMMPFFRMRGRLLCCLLLLGNLASALGHPILQNPMWIEFTEAGLEVRVDMSVRELIVVQGLPQDSDGSVDYDLALDLAPKHMPYLLDHLSFRADGEPLKGTIESIDPPKVIGKGLEGPDRAHFNVHVRYPFAGRPRTVAVSHRMCEEFPSAPGVPWDFSYAYRFGPKGAVPQLGALYRGKEVVFSTGFGPVIGEASGAVERIDVNPRRGSDWMLLTVLWAFLAGLGSGVLPVRLYQWAALAWLASFLGMTLSGSVLAHPLPAFLCGAAAALLAMDLLYAGGAGPSRRGILVVCGAAAFGAALAGIAPGEGGKPWLATLLGCALLAAGTGIFLQRKLRDDRPGLRAFRQVLALAAAGEALWIMLHLAGVTGS